MDNEQNHHADRARTGGHQHGQRGGGSPASAPDPYNAPDLAEGRFRALVHELANLVDGSMRYLRLAHNGLTGAELEGAQADSAMGHLQSAEQALAHVVDLIRAVSDPYASSGQGGPMTHGLARCRPLRETLEHAVDVLLPSAHERGVTMTLDMPEGIDTLPPAPLYAVVSNALRNAIEASSQGGRIEVRMRTTPQPAGGQTVEIDILDDGKGPTPASMRDAFDIGFTTKARGSGLGLALSQDIVQAMGGTIELRPRWQPGEGPDGRRGAVLSVRYDVDPGALDEGTPGDTSRMEDR